MSPARLSRHAFTLLELLTVVGIIAILISLLVVGGLKMIGTGKVASTRVTLNVLQNMLAEFDAKTRLGPAPSEWAWIDPDSHNVSPSPGGMTAQDPTVTVGFWKVPWSSTTSTPAHRYDALSAPGSVDESSAANRNLAPAILNSTQAMSLLLNMPSNRSALEKMAPDKFFVPQWTDPAAATNAVLMPNGTHNVLLAKEESSRQTAYAMGQIVELNKQRYRAVIDPGSTPPSPAATTPWMLLSNSVPLLQDAWNNPIIFVPGTGMRVRLLNGEKSYVDGSGNPLPDGTTFKVAIVASPEAQINSVSPTSPYVVKPGRPFFASAGPDGNFATGDDNLYSFEQQ